jgi:ATP-dependent exoDNAse (exonuclease V) beta subunit
MSQHWYCAITGAPRYTMQGKNGKERSVTLRDAKAAPGTLVPSVSTINQQLSKDGLNSWLQGEAIKACIENPRQEGEEEKDYIARCLDLAKQKSQEAMTRGTLIHDFLEAFYNQEYLPDMPTYVRKVDDAITAHFGAQLWIPEQSLVNQEGYGGKCDLYCKPRHDFNGVVIDFKTTEKSPGELTPYLEHTLQLAAYREVLAPTARCANVYINGTTGEVAIYEHKEQDLRDGYEMFLMLLKIYKLKTGLN